MYVIGLTRVYIKSSLSLPTKEKLPQEEKSLIKINVSFKKIIITKDRMIPHYNEDGIYMINIFDFLLNYDSLDI